MPEHTGEAEIISTPTKDYKSVTLVEAVEDALYQLEKDRTQASTVKVLNTLNVARPYFPSYVYEHYMGEYKRIIGER